MAYRQRILLLFTIMGFINSHAQELGDGTFGKGLVNFTSKDSTYSVKMGLRFQSLFTSGWELPSGGGMDAGESHFLIRRARLKFDGFAYSPKLRYKFQLGLANRDISGESAFTSGAPRYILDAVLQWNFYKNFELWAGQTKLPGNREELISSGSLATVDRSLLNSEFGLGREMGLQLRHSFTLGEEFLVREALALSMGEGRNVTSENLGGFHYTARAEVLPFGDFAAYSGADLDREATPKLALGITYDSNQNAVRSESNTGAYMFRDDGFFETDINTFFVDAMFKYQGISVLAEYASRNTDQALAVNSDGSLTGEVVNAGEAFNIQAGYTFPSNFQILGRYSEVTPEEPLFYDAQTQYTLALSKYLVGHKLKIQTDLSYSEFAQNSTDGLLYRLQFEIHL